MTLRGPRSPGLTRLAVVGLALAALALGACSIGTDDQPRELAVSTTSTTAPSSPTSGGSSAVLYFVRDGQLVPTTRSLPDHQIDTVLRSLLKAPPSDQPAQKLSTSIPVGTTLSSSRLDGGTLSVDLSDGFDNVVGPSRQQAIAQIVMTATEFPQVDRLRFSVAGKPVQVATPTRGDTSIVSDCDYRTLLAKPSDIDPPGTLPAAAAERLTNRQANLERHCPTGG